MLDLGCWMLAERVLGLGYWVSRDLDLGSEFGSLRSSGLGVLFLPVRSPKWVRRLPGGKPSPHCAGAPLENHSLGIRDLKNQHRQECLYYRALLNMYVH